MYIAERLLQAFTPVSLLSIALRLQHNASGEARGLTGWLKGIDRYTQSIF